MSLSLKVYDDLQNENQPVLLRLRQIQGSVQLVAVTLTGKPVDNGVLLIFDNLSGRIDLYGAVNPALGFDTDEVGYIKVNKL